MTTIKDELAELKEKFDKQDAKLEAIEQELARYKGFVGGILWVLAAMGAAVKLTWPLLKDLIGVK